MIGKLLLSGMSSPGRPEAGRTIQYLGKTGVTKTCVEAVERLLHRHRYIETVRLLSWEHRHAFLFALRGAEWVVVRAGFTSNSGEGSRGLRRALNLIQSVGLEVEEHDLDDRLFDRVNDAGLTWEDVERIGELPVVRPWRLWDYGMSTSRSVQRDGERWGAAELVIPLALIEPGLLDLAVSFWNDRNAALDRGYKRLEGVVRDKTGTDSFGVNLLKTAYLGSDSVLWWDGLPQPEQDGRAWLFVGAFKAFRNKRAHNEIKPPLADDVRELLLLNQLYVFAVSAQKRAAGTT